MSPFFDLYPDPITFVASLGICLTFLSIVYYLKLFWVCIWHYENGFEELSDDEGKPAVFGTSYHSMDSTDKHDNRYAERMGLLAKHGDIYDVESQRTEMAAGKSCLHVLGHVY
jgi:hypothetical protein